jgi:hypothetical protein
MRGNITLKIVAKQFQPKKKYKLYLRNFSIFNLISASAESANITVIPWALEVFITNYFFELVFTAASGV